MAAPILVLLGTLILWGVTSFVTSSLAAGGAGGEGLVSVARILNVIFGFVGMISVLAVPIGVVVGIVYLVTAPKPPTDSKTQTPA